MMADFDALDCRFGPLIAKHLAIASMIRDRDLLQRPKEYVAATFLAGKTSKLQYIQYRSPLPVLTNYFIWEFTVPPSNKPTADTDIKSPVSINTYPLMLVTSSEIKTY